MAGVEQNPKVCNGVCVTLASSLFPPFGRPLKALWDPMAVIVENPKVVHGIWLALASSLFIPLGRPSKALRDNFTSF